MAVFASDTRADGWTEHADYNTQTVNTTARWWITPSDLLLFKGVHNELFGDLSNRLSLNQYYLNPYQRGCALVTPTTNVLSAAWCGQGSVYLNGIAGPKAQTSPDLAGFHRNDRRDVIGLRWEHDFDNNTKWRTQADWDDKNIDQPTGTTSGLQDEPSVSASTDITQHWSPQGHDATSFAGLYFSRTRYVSFTGNTLPIGDGAYGATTQRQNGMQQNLGARAREELALTPTLTGVLGLAAEMTKIAAYTENFGYLQTGRSRRYGLPAARRQSYLLELRARGVDHLARHARTARPLAGVLGLRLALHRPIVHQRAGPSGGILG